MTKKVYLVKRQHDGDKQYWEGDKRTMLASDAKHLVDLGTLELIGDAEDEPAEEKAEDAPEDKMEESPSNKAAPKPANKKAVGTKSKEA
ncbi:hypothetical protein K3M67_03020 [Sphingobium sp. V4]|uniref:hypothetical protein n=1 Tax=Sphingobium sp. V4 TaxID=3038927 RepID=UPI002557C976|nr:hypothetical protein [Sphingobium sp. V4]WIW88968.1 hypothetical protein K3M67_03020 [Sphingobium sp. V4]